MPDEGKNLDPTVADARAGRMAVPAREIAVRELDEAGSVLPTAEVVWRGGSLDKRRARAALFRFAALVEECSAASAAGWYVTPPSAILSRGVDSYVGRVSIELDEDASAAEIRAAMLVLTAAVDAFRRR